MAYLNHEQHSDCSTPRKLRLGKKQAPTTPTHRMHNKNAGSPAVHVSSHRSSPSSAKVRRPAPYEAYAFSPNPVTHAMSSTALNRSVGQPRDVSHLHWSCTASPVTANLNRSPMLFSPSSKTAKRLSSRPDHCPSSNVSKSFHQLNVHLGNKRHTNNEEVNVALENNVISNDGGEKEDQEAEEIHGLSEAKAVYANRNLPDFVIQRPKDGLAREVMVRPCKKRHQSLMYGKLVFEFWNQDATNGFWTLTDDEGYKWIVKYFACSQEYRAWIGIESGYNGRGLAFPPKNGHNLDVRGLTSQMSVVRDSEESREDHVGMGRSLRKRNIDQIHPYSTEKMNYERSKDGKKKQNFKTQCNSDREVSVLRSSTTIRRPNHRSGFSRTVPTARISAGHIKPPSKSGLISGSAERKVTVSPKPEPMSIEKIQNNTTLYIFTHSDFEAPPVPIYLKSCKDLDSFLSTVLLVASAEERDVRQITIKFDWLPASKPNTIRVIRGVSDSYDKMMEEICGAPAWQNGGDGKVNVSVNVVLKY